jgi:hypothetical protein
MADDGIRWIKQLNEIAPDAGSEGFGLYLLKGHPVFLMNLSGLQRLRCVDAGTHVDDKDYQVPFRFTGTLKKLSWN